MESTTTTTTGKNPFAGISLTQPTEEEEEEEEVSTKDEEAPESVEEKTAEGLGGPSGDKACFPPVSSMFTMEGRNGQGSSLLANSVFTLEPPTTPPEPLFPASPLGKTGSKGSKTNQEDEENPDPPQTVDEEETKEPTSVNTGEEAEETVFANTAILYQNIDGNWKTMGRGELKLNVDEAKQGRLLLRQDGTLKLLLNARLYPEMTLVAMGEDAVSFSCANAVGNLPSEDSSSDQYTINAIRIKGNSERLRVFTTTVEEHKVKK